MKSKHAKGDCRNASSAGNFFFSREDLKCKATWVINEDYWCDYNGTTQGEGRGKGRTELNA